jgi:anti-sigma factor ChrR (cupin superfamily)
VNLNADPMQRAVVQSAELPWTQSPTVGVRRRLLARDGDEESVATSIVEYAPGASFTRHAHPFGEEFLVLSGTFEDEHGSYPEGSYVKNPPGSEHTPSSSEGCTLFVKLRHLRAGDCRRVVLRPIDHPWRQGLVPGLQVLPLDEFGSSHTALVRWAPGTLFARHWHPGGEEIFVVSGVFEDEFQAYPAGSWIRSPHMSTHQPFSIQGCLILVKVGHLHPLKSAF